MTALSFYTRRPVGPVLPVHTVRARWGSRPGYVDTGRVRLPWAGYPPDWHVLVVRYRPDVDRAYPYWVEGWLPGRGDGPCCEPFCWRVPSLADPRYDLTEAVAL